VNELRIYFEGDSRLRPGFRQFFSEIAEAANRNGWRLAAPVATGGKPVQAFRIALQTHSSGWNVLLLDWEDPNEAESRKKQLGDCDPDSVFWMVQIMESWFLADVDALKAVFKGGLSEAVLRGNPNVEQIPKEDVLARLKKAANGEYHKVKHGTKLLQLIDPVKVRKAAPDCDRMFRLILARLR
jgi:predicted RecB family endonuclease